MTEVNLKHLSFFIVDPQFLTRNGIRTILEKLDGMRFVGDAEGTIEEWKRSAFQAMPDLLIADYSHETKPEDFIDQLEHLGKFMKVLIISDDTNIRRVNGCINNGVSGFLTKECDEDEVMEAVQKISNGERFFCNKILDLIMQEGQQESISSLSDREIEVLTLIVQGLTTKKIADQIHVSVHTVNSHRKNMLKKLGFKSPAQLISFAINQGIPSL